MLKNCNIRVSLLCRLAALLERRSDAQEYKRPESHPFHGCLHPSDRIGAPLDRQGELLRSNGSRVGDRPNAKFGRASTGWCVVDTFNDLLTASDACLVHYGATGAIVRLDRPGVWNTSSDAQ